MANELLLNRIATLLIFKEGIDSIFIEDFRIEFDIKKTNKSEPNSAKIIIYNLNESAKKIIEEKDLNVNLSVGYKGEGEEPVKALIFQGNVTKTETKKNNADFLTILEVGDSLVNLVNINLNKSYKAGTPIKTIVKDLISTLNVEFDANALNKLSNKKFNNGFTAEGSAKKNLDDLIKSEGFYYTVQNGQLIITKDDEINGVNALVLNKNTGLLDIPIKTDKGIEVKALINPRLKATDTVKIESEFLKINSFYKVSNIDYKGDTRGNDWFMKVEAIST